MSQAETQYALGWDPVRSKAARAELLASRRFYRVGAPTAPLRPAYSMTAKRLRHLEQYQAGTCWEHAGTQLAEVTAVAHGYDAFPVCRRLVGWVGKQLEGGGNQANGGSGIDALQAMTADKGVGIAHESLCPYITADMGQWQAARFLAPKPPQAVFDDAKKSHLEGVVDVQGLDEAQTLLNADRPTCIGIWWTPYWDSRQTFMDSIGGGSYGHELLIIGYAKPGVFNQYEWIQLDNWHGLLYPPLSAENAAKVPGYEPITATATSDFWVRRDKLETVIGYGDAEFSSAADVSGIESKIFLPNWDDAFPL